MKRATTHFFILASALSLSLALITSCSIKEDRWPCPCRLIFMPGEGVDLNAPGGFTLTVSGAAGKELSTDISWRQIRDDDYDVSVSKGEKEMNILSGRKDSFLSGTRLLIVKGKQSDSIYSSVSRVSCLGEEAVVPVDMLKQFSTVFLDIRDGGKRWPYFIRIRGAVDGIDLSSLQPSEGEFLFEPEPGNDLNSRFEFRLPRQLKGREQDLAMEIWRRGENLQQSDVLIETMPLGRFIEESHHDWEKPSLDDIHITIDFSQITIGISINDWIIDWDSNISI